MNILILGLNFYPELTGIGRYTGEMAAFLAGQGHQVRMVTTPPYYPHWKIGAGHKAWEYRREVWRGVEVYRCPLWVSPKPGGLQRLLHLGSFALSSLPVLAGQLLWKPDLVLCIAPALANAPFALAYAWLTGAKGWLHIQDFELDAAFSLNILGGGKGLRSIALRVEAWLLKGFGHLSTISPKMLARAFEKGYPPERASLFPNWVDTRQVYPLEGHNPLRTALGLDDKVVILYHGNMSRKQGLDLLIEAAVLLESEASICFILCGDGTARSELEIRAQGLKNVRFLDVQPEEDLNYLVNLADIHVLLQLPEAADLVMPSKLTSMLASGKPVVACANVGTQVWEVVQSAGVVVPPASASLLVQALRALAGNLQERVRLGALGRQYAERYLDRQVILGEFGRSVEKVCGR